MDKLIQIFGIFGYAPQPHVSSEPPPHSLLSQLQKAPGKEKRSPESQLVVLGPKPGAIGLTDLSAGTKGAVG